MPTADRSLDIVAFVSEHFRDFLRRRLSELAGLALLTLTLLAAITLATWSVQDPSLSHATQKPVQNLLGYPGAIVADLAMQLFGLACRHAAAADDDDRLEAAGAPQLRRKTPRVVVDARHRAVCRLRRDAAAHRHLALPTGLGGVVGDAVLHLPRLIGLPLNLFVLIVLSPLLALATAATAALAAGWRSQQKTRRAAARDADEDDDDSDDEEEATDRASAWLGMIVHALLSWKARIGRWLRRAPRPAMRAMPAASDGRYEPRFDGFGRVPVNAEPVYADEEDEEEEAQPAPRRRQSSPRAPVRRSSGGFTLPSLNLLTAQRPSERTTLSKDLIDANAVALESVLGDFGVRGEIINARPGPVVTLYELEPAPGIKSSRVIGLADDIARSMSAVSARVAVVSGRNAIGIELPNPTREKVYLRELLTGKDYNEHAAKLPLCLGKTIGGESVIVDLSRMPHLLIAGTTGSGKSVAINTMILSLVYRLRPDQCRLIMVDPKMLELSVYDGIPHLLTPVVTDPKKAVVALKWAVREMEGRYKAMSKLGVRNIDGYNARLAEAKAKGESLQRTVHTGYDKESGEAIYEKEELDLEPLPYLVVIVDEMADLMMVAGKDIEGAIQRLAQMARAAGIHVILATQRPSVDVITGTIKANFPTRISFQVTSKIDSRTILGEMGAEQLLGQGDMLYMAGGGRISRVHGPFVSDDEVEKVVRHLKSQGVPDYLEEVTASDELEEGEDGAVFDSTGMGLAEGGDLFEQAVAIVKRDRKASTSYIQRRLQIGYNRAATLMERMEQEGIIGQPNHAGKREILIPEDPPDRY